MDFRIQVIPRISAFQNWDLPMLLREKKGFGTRDKQRKGLVAFGGLEAPAANCSSVRPVWGQMVTRTGGFGWIP